MLNARLAFCFPLDVSFRPNSQLEGRYPHPQQPCNPRGLMQQEAQDYYGERRRNGWRVHPSTRILSKPTGSSRTSSDDLFHFLELNINFRRRDKYRMALSTRQIIREVRIKMAESLRPSWRCSFGLTTGRETRGKGSVSSTDEVARGRD